MSPNVEQFEYDNATAFIDALRPSSDLWASNPGNWIFRGHWDSRWRLLPSVNRRSQVRRYAAVGEGDEYFEPDWETELELLASVAWAINNAGIAVPQCRVLTEAQGKAVGIQSDPRQRRNA